MAKRSKDELAEVAKTYGVELDLTQPWADLNAQVQTLENGGADENDEAQEEAQPDPQVRRFFRNRVTGQVVPFSPIFEKNADLELIEEPIEPEAPAQE